MIEAEIHRNGTLIVQRNYHEPALSLEQVLKHLELYVTQEQLNSEGECLLRCRFANLQQPAK